MTEEELKPCPFCGSATVIDMSYHSIIYIGCTHDACIVPRYTDMKTSVKSHAIERWNTRTGTDNLYLGRYKQLIPAIQLTGGWSNFKYWVVDRSEEFLQHLKNKRKQTHKLKPCPCCGNEVAISVKYDEGQVDAGNMISCPNCTLRTKWEGSTHKAIEEWNRRK